MRLAAPERAAHPWRWPGLPASRGCGVIRRGRRIAREENVDIPSERPVAVAGNEIDRPVPSAPSNRVFGSDAIAAAIRELDIPYVALNPGIELSRIARQPGQLSRQQPAAHAAVPARGECRGVGAWLGQGHRPADAGHRARQCRADACDDGDLQCLVRPGAGHRARRHRRARRDPAAAVDRMDPHRARPGCLDPQFQQMGRPALFDRGGAGGGVARQHDRADRTARAGLSQFRPGTAGRRDRGGAADARHCAFCAAGLARTRRRADPPGRRVAGAGRAAGDPDGPRLARPRGMAAAGRTGRGGRRAGHDRPQGRGGVPDRPSAARCRSRRFIVAGRRRAGRRRRCDPEPRLDRPRRHVEGGLPWPAARRQGDPGLARPVCPQWLEHGLPGPAADRCLPAGRAGRCRPSAFGRDQGIAAERTGFAGAACPALAAALVGARNRRDHRGAAAGDGAEGGARPMPRPR